MEYFTCYGLEFNPFLKNSKEILVDTSEYKETLFRLDYLAKSKRLWAAYRKSGERQNDCCKELGCLFKSLSI